MATVRLCRYEEWIFKYTGGARAEGHELSIYLVFFFFETLEIKIVAAFGFQSFDACWKACFDFLPIFYPRQNGVSCVCVWKFPICVSGIHNYPDRPISYFPKNELSEMWTIILSKTKIVSLCGNYAVVRLSVIMGDQWIGDATEYLCVGTFFPFCCQGNASRRHYRIKGQRSGEKKPTAPSTSSMCMCRGVVARTRGGSLFPTYIFSENYSHFLAKKYGATFTTLYLGENDVRQQF